jgi:hypothetical protein
MNPGPSLDGGKIGLGKMAEGLGHLVIDGEVCGEEEAAIGSHGWAF